MIGRIYHTWSVRLYLWVGEQTDRVERNDANVEHATNDLLMEWDHLVHTLPAVVASITGQG